MDSPWHAIWLVGFPDQRRALIGSNQVWPVNDSLYHQELTAHLASEYEINVKEPWRVDSRFSSVNPTIKVAILLGAPFHWRFFPSQFNSDGNFVSFSPPLVVIKYLYMTWLSAVLSWNVQKFAAIWWPATELQQCKVSIEFELQKVVSKMGPRPGEDFIEDASGTSKQPVTTGFTECAPLVFLLKESALGDCKLLNRTTSYYEILFLTRPPANPHVIQRFMRPAAEMSKVWALTTIFESKFHQGYRQKEADSHILKWSL